MKENILVFPEIENLTNYLRDIWVEQAVKAIEEKGFFTSVLSGGKTPMGFYKKLTSVENIPWERVFFFLSDERYVHWSDDNSNYRNIKDILFSRIDIPGENIYRFDTTSESILECAADYEKSVEDFFFKKGITFPEFDFILLGIGVDGHTASLFPEDRALAEDQRIAVPVDKSYSGYKRLTLTLPLLNSGKRVYFMITGDEKAEVARELLKNHEKTFPASRVQPFSEEISFLLDKKAAHLL